MLHKLDTEKLRQAQLEKGWSDAKLATEAGVGAATIWRIFNRTADAGYRPNISTVEKVASALGVPMSEVVLVPEQQTAEAVA